MPLSSQTYVGSKQVENSTYSISYPMSPKNLQYKPLKVCLVFETVKGNYAINLRVNVSLRDRFSIDSGLLEMFYKWTWCLPKSPCRILQFEQINF